MPHPAIHHSPCVSIHPLASLVSRLPFSSSCRSPVHLTRVCRHAHRVHMHATSNKRVKGRSHTVEKRNAIHPQKPHATSQPSRLPLVLSRNTCIDETVSTRNAVHVPESGCVPMQIYIYIYSPGVGRSSRGSRVCVTMLALQCQC